ncbi:hypothetical protein AX768_09000 [Burkholderia sp. PAMC 28687]|uniref:hypothetical protein n=1 Tax=Burkholderia sp. PAMC 28687 TaxID=1795874 RepID=UPI00078472D7|nr:hypothetical protein [Burkholderia sp. PAMC 28687]AMM14209.1 hypothetical protein AX768_09000 [Burkholderia sp. PAMC 28687]
MKFQYTRTKGKKRTYEVTATVEVDRNGIVRYTSSIQCDGLNMGSGLTGRAIKVTNPEAAEQAVRDEIIFDIESLSGVVE